jgi:hypothetical protein
MPTSEIASNRFPSITKSALDRHSARAKPTWYRRYDKELRLKIEEQLEIPRGRLWSFAVWSLIGIPSLGRRTNTLSLIHALPLVFSQYDGSSSSAKPLILYGLYGLYEAGAWNKGPRYPACVRLDLWRSVVETVLVLLEV